MEFGTLESFQICYETYGSPNADKSNVILICHALTGDHHVAGVHKKRWKVWMVGSCSWSRKSY